MSSAVLGLILKENIKIKTFLVDGYDDFYGLVTYEIKPGINYVTTLFTVIC